MSRSNDLVALVMFCFVCLFVCWVLGALVSPLLLVFDIALFLGGGIDGVEL